MKSHEGDRCSGRAPEPRRWDAASKCMMHNGLEHVMRHPASLSRSELVVPILQLPLRRINKYRRQDRATEVTPACRMV